MIYQRQIWLLISVADPWHLVRIWIRGSVSLANGSGFRTGSCYFRQWRSRWQLKIFFFFKYKSHEEVTKQKESRFFLLILLDDKRIPNWSRIRTVRRTSGSRSGRPKNIRIRILISASKFNNREILMSKRLRSESRPTTHSSVLFCMDQCSIKLLDSDPYLECGSGPRSGVCTPILIRTPIMLFFIILHCFFWFENKLLQTVNKW